jgi:transposase-like protein
MARKNYTEEFRRQAVDLYRSTPGATLRGIAADLGISRHTLQVWVHALDPDPTSSSSEPAARQGNRHWGKELGGTGLRRPSLPGCGRGWRRWRPRTPNS